MDITSLLSKKTRKIADTSIEDEPETEESRHREVIDMMKTMSSKMDHIEQKLDSVDQRFSQMDQKIIAMHKDQQLQNAAVDTLRKENTKLHADNAIIRAELKAVVQTVKAEALKRDDLENQQRRYNVELSGFPKVEGEDCRVVVADLMRHLGCKNGIDSVDVAHRKMSGGIIARFSTRSARDELYQRRFDLKNRKVGDIQGYQGDHIM